MLIGVGGIALVAFLVSWILFTPSPMIVRLVYVLAFVLTFAQVALGFRILAVPDQMLAMAHQGIAIIILVLLAVGGMLAARGRRKSKATAAAPA
jgi:heme A synthase